MGYNAYDFFSDQILPQLKALLKSTEDPDGLNLENFLEIIKKSVFENGFSSSGGFKRMLLATILDTENNSIEHTLNDLFISLYGDDVVLRKLEYESNRAIIIADYNQFSKEKEIE